MLRRLAFFAILVVAISLPNAASAFYVGAAVGQASTEDNVGDLHFDEDTTGWKVYGGFRFFKFLGVEASYVDFGSPSDSAAGVEWKADTQAYDAFAVGALPIGEHFEVFAKWGVVVVDSEVDVSGVFGNIDSSNTDTDMAYGAGAAFIFGSHIAIRVEYEQFEAGDIDDLFMYSAGVDFRF